MQPFIQLIERHERLYPAEGLLEGLALRSLAIRQPSTGDVIEWTDAGDRLSRTPEDIVRRVSLGEQITFEVWFQDGLGVAVSFRRLDDSMYSVAFSLWGLEPREMEPLATYSIDRFRTLAHASQAVLLVVDTRGVTAEFDWYEFVRGRELPPLVPDVIGLPAERIPEIRPLIPGRTREAVAKCVLVFSASSRGIGTLAAEDSGPSQTPVS